MARYSYIVPVVVKFQIDWYEIIREKFETLILIIKSDIWYSDLACHHTPLYTSLCTLLYIPLYVYTLLYNKHYIFASILKPLYTALCIPTIHEARKTRCSYSLSTFPFYILTNICI